MNVKNFHGRNAIDSREVAEMVEKQHKHLLRDIAGYIKIMEESNEPKFGPVDFFIPSTYQDSKGETRPCYLITKKGCDMIANKLTGKKGVLFTAAYTTTFDNMERALKSGHYCRTPKVSPGGLARLMEVHKQAIIDSGGTPADVAMMIAELDQTWGVPVPSTLAAQLPGQLYLFDRPALECRKYLEGNV